MCENDKTDSRPLERKRHLSFEKLILSVALGTRDEDTLTSLAGRLASLDRETTDNDKKEISKVSDGKSLKELVNRLLDATDPDTQLGKAKELFKTEEPTADQLDKATKELILIACNPFDNPNLRNTLIAIKKRNEQIIDDVSKDKIIDAGWDTKAKEKAQGVIASFKQFIADNKDELTALQFIYSKPYGTRHLTYEAISELAGAIEKPP